MVTEFSPKVFLGLISLSLLELFSAKISIAIPLQPGLYHGGGSRYIEIHQQGNRICYRGFSPNGNLITSVEADLNSEDIYTLNNTNLSVVQKNQKTLLFGARSQSLLEYQLESSLDSSEAENSQIKDCLNTTTPFYSIELN